MLSAAAHYAHDSNSRGSSSPVPSNSNNSGSNSSGSIQTTTSKQRSSSIKLALGVRKSCDASIISSMRKVSLSGSSTRNSREQLSSMKEQSPAEGQDNEQQQQQTTEIILRDAMSACGVGSGRPGSHSHGGNKLAVDQAKPRSRSLIWRPSRKSSKTSTNDSSECRVT